MDSDTSSHQPSSGLNNSTINADLSLWADKVIFGESEGSEDESVSPYLYKNGNVISRSKSYKRRDESVTSPKANGNDSSSRQSGRHITIEMNHKGEENTDDLKNDADSPVDQEDSNGQNNSDPAQVNTGSGIHDDTTVDWVDIDLDTDDEEQTNATSSSRPNSSMGNGQTPFVQIGNTSAHYLITFIDILYYFGISPVKGDGKNPRGKWSVVCFFLLTVLAILQAFEVLKLWVLLGDPDKNVHVYYVRLGYLAGILILRVWFECLVGFKFKSIINLVGSIQEFKLYTSKKRIFTVVLLPLLTSILIAIGYPIVDSIVEFGGNLKTFIVYRSFRFSMLLFLWSTPDEEEIDYLIDVYGANVTLASVAMGTAELSITIIGYFQQNLIRDLCWIVTLTFYGLVVIFQNELACSNVNSESCSKIWFCYKALLKVSKDLNKAFGVLFQLFHLDNLFFCAYFIYEHIMLGRNLSYALLHVVPLLKILSFYIFAARSSLVNSDFQDWIHQKFCGQNTLFEENGEVVGTLNLLHKITSDPIGIGRNMFFIDASFLWKIGSIGGSYSFLFAQADR